VTGQPAVIIGGGAVGCETALLLARIGTISETLYFLLKPGETPRPLSVDYPGIQEITIIEMMAKIGRDIGARPAGRSSRTSTAGGYGASYPPGQEITLKAYF
jgi:hypothetical protein